MYPLLITEDNDKLARQSDDVPFIRSNACSCSREQRVSAFLTIEPAACSSVKLRDQVCRSAAVCCRPGPTMSCKMQALWAQLKSTGGAGVVGILEACAAVANA